MGTNRESLTKIWQKQIFKIISKNWSKLTLKKDINSGTSCITGCFFISLVRQSLKITMKLLSGKQ